jgi:FXSXX-COOH protein
MEPSPDGIDTDLPDLTDLPLSAIRSLDARILRRPIDRILRETERPRANLDGSGPPGRFD